MSSDNDLIDLGRLIEDATEDLKRAQELAYRFGSASPEDGDPGWGAMSVLGDNLEEIGRLLAKLPGDEIAEAIKQADAYLDHLSDLADGQSY